MALVGNPNCGKTSLFNKMTGLNQKVGNFPGVTIDRKLDFVRHGEQKLKIVDLPGTYSLYPKSPEEIVVNDVLLNEEDADHPDVIVVVLDASNLKRNLYLLTQIYDLHIPFVIALNMTDLAAKSGLTVRRAELEKVFDAPVVETHGREGKGTQQLFDSIVQYSETSRSSKPLADFGYDAAMIQEAREKHPDFSEYKIAFLADHSDNATFLAEGSRKFFRELGAKYRPDFSKIHLEEVGYRYKFIQSIIEKITTEVSIKRLEELNDKADKWLTHPVFGWLIFLFVFFLLFQAVFTIAAYPTDWIDQGMGALITWVGSVLPAGMFNDFITNGVLSGINGIVVFIPQIMILFGLITILEDTGYMARVSFINDKLLSRVGMNGKSVVPIVGGFACAVPSIMAARSISNPRERLITIFITPLMSCSARLPVYIFLIAFLVEERYLFGFINVQGLVMVGLYLLGVVFSVLVSALLNFFLRKERASVFTLEMPSFKMPRWKNVVVSMLNNGKTFVREAGKVILIVTIILWGLTSFGPGDGMEQVEMKYAEVELNAADQFTMQSELLENSYAGMIGKGIEPVIEPLGFDWKTGIAIITSFAAREVFVGTMATIYSVDGDSDNTIEELQHRLMNEVDPATGAPVLNFAKALSLILFYVFALQCASTVAVVRKETGGWKWPAIQFFAFTALAWIASFISYSALS